MVDHKMISTQNFSKTQRTIHDNFKSDIVDTYNKLVSNKIIKINGDEADISDLLHRYILDNSEFTAAEKFLEDCGFKLNPRPGRKFESSNRLDKYDVYASSANSIIKSPSWGISITIIVLLTPNSPDEYMTVQSCIAYITVKSI